MGLLTVGHPLNWAETKQVVDYVKEHGVQQFIRLYHKLKDRQGDCLKWGDEIEYMIVKFDHQNKKARVSLRGEEILKRLMAKESPDPTKNEFLWRPEYASYMVEGTPGMPYGGLLQCFNVVEGNMKNRRREAQALLEKDEILLTIGNFPRLGCLGFMSPHLDPTPSQGVTHSLFFPDDVIYKAHPRFKNLSRNIRERRGEKVVINVPAYRDEKTPARFETDEDLIKLGDANGEARKAYKPYHIYMDAMGFGMGCCCLQVTFQTVNVMEARWLYDQLTPITPVLLALSASTPIYRGYLADVDCRWNIISASVDDRTLEERGVKPLRENKFVIQKSRYDTTSCYLYGCSSGYNDIPLQYEEKHYKALKDGGVDELLAQHIAHLFIRDPLQVYRERITQDDDKSTEHFETIQSSNWCNMRFKPPPIDQPSIGWRVEFRPTEVQLTDFENAAYVCFVVLLTRVIISFRLTFLIPISKVQENMARAQRRNAINQAKFYFRRTLTTCDSPPEAQRACWATMANGPQASAASVRSQSPNGPKKAPSGSPQPPKTSSVTTGTSSSSSKQSQSSKSTQKTPPTTPEPRKPPSDDYIEMTINEIVNGKPPDFPGLVPLIRQYLDSAEVDVDTRCTIQQYLMFIEKRARGDIWTLARWMREFVMRHPAYKKDSHVTDEITYDLVKTMDDIAQGRAHCPCLLGGFLTKSRDHVPTSVALADLMYRNYAKARDNSATNGKVA